MTIFFVEFEVRPTERNSQFERVGGAIAHCWVLEDSALAAYNKAWFYVWRDEWEITDSTLPIEVVEEDFRAADIGREQFARAERDSMALVYVAWSRDGLTRAGPTPLARSGRFDLNDFVQTQRRLAAKARCLHFDSDGQCQNFCEAHSIQKEGLLREISRDGQVYVPSRNIGTLRKTKGKLVLEPRGIGTVSTFLGFCNQHDSLLFAPIDTALLFPTDAQVALYAYRTLCRELFVKENAFAMIEEQVAKQGNDRGAKMLFEAYRTGPSSGLENLRRHKAEFDESLRKHSYRDVEYTLFAFKQKPFVAFSAVFYPEFDFLGRRLQDLADFDIELDLLTICSAQMQDGWGLLFSWHKTSSTACRGFLGSLATVIHDGRSGEEALFRMALSSCENLAIAPSWWEARNEGEREKICSALTLGTSPFTPSPADYLVTGLEGIGDWKIEGVYEHSGS